MADLVLLSTGDRASATRSYLNIALTAPPSLLAAEMRDAIVNDLANYWADSLANDSETANIAQFGFTGAIEYDDDDLLDLMAGRYAEDLIEHPDLDEWGKLGLCDDETGPAPWFRELVALPAFQHACAAGGVVA
jgi:hypothetical protein